MKKTFLSFILLLILSFGYSVKADELILYTDDNFKVTTENFIQDESKYISLVKNSNLKISFTNNSKISLEDSEAKVDLKIFKRGTKELVYSVESPKTSSNPDRPDFEDYLLQNKNYFDTVFFENDKINFNIPLKLDEGKYDTVLSVNRGSEKTALDFYFNVSDSYYNFTTSDIVIEDNDVLASIGYVSLLDKDQTNKIVVTLNQEGVEIFKKEFEKMFYSEGVVLIDEKIDALSTLSGQVDLKIEVREMNDKVILSQIKTIELQKTKNINMYYMIIIGFIILILIIIFLILKRKNRQMAIGTFTFLFVLGLSLFSVNVSADVCDLSTKPADKCLNGQTVTSVCLQEEQCTSATDNEYKRVFSTNDENTSLRGGMPNIDESDSSVTVNICNYYNVWGGSSALTTGTPFYVVSDSLNSSWSKKRYHIFSFVKGTPLTHEFDPGGNKRNTNKGVYDGNCTVTVSSKYKGDSSNSEGERVKLVETGLVTNSICKNRFVNGDNYENNGNLLNSPSCNYNYSNTNTYIKGSVEMSPVRNTGVSRGSWKPYTVNICNYLGVQANSVKGQNFYALFNQYSAWTKISYPVFEFTFGTAKPVATLDENRYIRKDNKENEPQASYDGSCNITFQLKNRGEDTDQWQSGYDLIELGFTAQASCRDPKITEPSAYRDSKTEALFKPARYNKIAPFFMPLAGCQGTGASCKLKGTWIDSYTDKSCGLAESCTCNNRDQVCKTSTTTITTVNSSACALSSSCTFSSDATNNIYTIIPINGIGNITYKVATTTASQNNTNPYVYTTLKSTGAQSINVILTDAYDGQTSTASCYVANEVTTEPPSINLSKKPSVTLNKNGTCTISWDIQNMPSTATCVLSGNYGSQTITGQGSQTFGPLTSNQKYTVTCSGEGLDTPIVKSEICRINPNIKEN